MSAPDQTLGFFTLDQNLVVRSWDVWLASASGIAAETATGQPIGSLIPDLEARGILARIRRTLTDGVVEVLAPAFHHYLIRCATAQPSRHFDCMQQRVTIAPLLEAGHIAGAIVTVEDVTGRLDRERELDERLTSPDEAVRARAVEELSGAPQVESNKLGAALSDKSWRVRREAAIGLARHGGEQVVASAIRALRTEHANFGTLNSALQVLASVDFDVVGPLVELLDSPEADVRIQSALALGTRPDPRAVAALLRTLDDPDANVQYHAIEALGKLGAAEAVDRLAALAESKDFFLAFPALDALTRIGDPRVAPRFVPLLESPLLRAAAADALGSLGDEEAVAPLAAALNRPDAQAATVARALGELYERYESRYGEGAFIADRVRATVTVAGAGNLLQAVGRADPESLRSVVVVLGWLDGAGIDRALARLLGQRDARKEVIEALVRHGENVTGLLVEQAAADDPEICKAAVIALGRIGSPRAAPALTGALAREPEIVIAAAEALARIGATEAFDALLPLLGDPDATVRQSAVAALNSIGHPEMAARVVRLLEDPDALVRESAVRIAGYFGFSDCAPLVLARCRDEHESVRRAAIEHLPYLDHERALPTLAGAAEHESPGVRAAAARALAHVEAGAAASRLLPMLADADPWVRYFAARSLGRVRSAEAVESLSACARGDAAPQVRIAALEALGSIGGSRACSLLASFVEADNLDEDQVRAALEALGRIPHPNARRALELAVRSDSAARRLTAVRGLASHGDADVAQLLQWTAAADGDLNVAQAAIDGLASLGAPEASAALIELAAEASRREQCTAALAKLEPAGLDALAGGLRHPHSGVRRAVVEALGRMKSQAATALLDDALDDQEAPVRMTAAVVLARLGSRRSELKLGRLARNDPDEGVRSAARRALERPA